MPTSCCAVGCTNRLSHGGSIRFFRIPARDPERRCNWLAAISRKSWQPKEHTRICSDHFVTGTPSDDKTHPDFIPSIFNHKPKTPVAYAKKNRYVRAQKRQKAVEEKEIQIKKMKLDEQKVTASTAEALMELATQSPRIKDKATWTDADPVTIDNKRLTEENKQLYKELARLQTQKDTLGKALADATFGVNFLKRQNNSDELFTSFTGIDSCKKFEWLVELVDKSIDVLEGITIPDQVLLVLMKLKLNNKHLELAIKFGIKVRKVSRVLHNVIPHLAASLKMLINWPTREACIQHLPPVFKVYPRCRVIIDCTEVFIERPSNLTARAQTWSNYKHHNTIKFLVGITPTGSISYLSKCWGGRVSDKQLTQDSDFLTKLEYGDQVLADRGFLIEEDVANCCAELIIPAFTKGKKQLSQRDTEITRQIARVRIHVERAIGRIKNFAILADVYPISLIKHANDVVLICSALTNMRPMLIK